jgi:hypothetical protein
MLTQQTTPGDYGHRAPRRTKKAQILALYRSGLTDLEALAARTQARPSYVGSVLQHAGLLPNYFDLYTSVASPMNVYSKQFANQLGFKNEAAARHSVDVIDRCYRQFAAMADRAGQHHALSMALVMFDRARWTGKVHEADVFRQWLIDQLAPEHAVNETQTAPHAEAATVPDEAVP